MQNMVDTMKGRKDGLRELSLMLWERWLAITAFVLVGLFSVIALNLTVPANQVPNLGLLGKKTEYLRNAHQDYNVLLIGTSRTYRGVDPVLLERIAKRRGCDVRAFNFGVPKLRLTELRHLRDHWPATLLKEFDLILLSPMAASNIAAANWASNRIQHFTDWNGYWDSLIDIWHAPLNKALPKKLFYSVRLSGALAYRQLGVGRLAKGLQGGEEATADNPSGDVFDGSALVDFSRHGYIALDDEPSQQFIKRGRQIKNNPGYFDDLKALSVAVDDFRGPVAERAWKRFAWAMESLADFDVPIALFLPPLLTFRPQDQVLAERAEARGVPVLNYNRLDLYPELFDRKHWFDYYHVGKSGAEQLTRLIGQDICSLIDKREG